MNEKIGFVIVCYNNLEVVRETIQASLKLPVKLILVDNHSVDRRVSSYLQVVSDYENVTVLDPGRNLGCHMGFNYGFSHALSHQNCDLLVKCDDDTLPPKNINFDAIESFFSTYKNIAFAGTDFFNDDRIKKEQIKKYYHDGFSTNFAIWDDIINIPFGIIRADFYRQFGLHVSYRTAGGETITSDDHLYGGEEAYLCEMAKLNNWVYGYLTDLHATPISWEKIDGDYMLWKYVFGYLGTYKKDFSEFKEDIEAKTLGYKYWLAYSDNGVHKLLAKKFLDVE